MSSDNARAEVITVLLADQRTGKSYSLRDGKLAKGKAAATAKGRAHGVPIYSAAGLVELLEQVTSDSSAVLIPGHFIGNDDDEPFNIVFEQELADLLGKQKGDPDLAGIQNIDGDRVAARLKRGIEPCLWQLLDFDTPEGMPPKFANLDIAGRLALMEKAQPGISTCERVEARSSSARIVKPGGVPGPASHAWIQVSDPALVDLLRVHIQIEAALHDLSFLSPHYSTKTGEVVGQSRLTLFDLAVLVRGRIVFCSAPTITPAMAKAGWSVADAGVTIVNPGGGALDVSSLTKPEPERLTTYRETTGEHLEISGQGASFAVVSRGVLDMATAIETDNAPVKTFGGAVKWLRGQAKGKHLRCQTPFRDSVSEAAFIALDEQGEPYLHDVGTATTYRLPERLDEPPPLTEEPDSDPAEAAAPRRKPKATHAKPHAAPTIRELPGGMEANAEQAFAALIAQGEVYRRGRILVVPDASVILDTRRGKQQHAAVVALDPANLKRLLDEAATFLRKTKDGKLVPTYPTSRLCAVLLGFVSDQPTGLPVLDGVMRMPFLRRDGSICAEPGYDESSSIFCHFNTREASS